MSVWPESGVPACWGAGATSPSFGVGSPTVGLLRERCGGPCVASFGVRRRRVASRGLHLRVGPRRRVVGPRRVSPFGGSLAAERGRFATSGGPSGSYRWSCSHCSSGWRGWRAGDECSFAGVFRTGAAGVPSGPSAGARGCLSGPPWSAAAARLSGREPRANASARDPHVGEARRCRGRQPSGCRPRQAVRGGPSGSRRSRMRLEPDRANDLAFPRSWMEGTTPRG